MWGLLFLTVYGKETVLCAITKTSKKTFRKWVWKVVPRIAGMYAVLVSVLWASFCTVFVLLYMLLTYYRLFTIRFGGRTGFEVTKEEPAK